MDQILREYIVMFLNYVIESLNSSEMFNISTVGNANWLVSTLEVVVYALLSYAVVFLFKSTLIKFLRNKLEAAEWEVGKYLVKNHFFTRLVHLIPMLFLSTLVGNLENDAVKTLSVQLVDITFVVLVVMLIFSVFNSFQNVLENHKRFKQISMNPIFQALKMIVVILTTIYIASIITDKSLTAIFTALGALSAVLLYIFKGTISNFVSYIQIISFKLFKRMDWVVLKKYGADGEVLNIELNLVRVKNWDKTIVTIPTSAFTTESLVNFANMSREGRRIKREVNIDMNTIKELSVEDIERMKKVNVLSDYINEKVLEHNETNKDIAEEDYALNGKTLTNIGTFRKYLEYYLKNNEEINEKHTLLVRQLASTSEGVPIQVYCFTKNTAWVHFEGVQSDIFDHIFKVLPYFGLSVYQKPSGEDFLKILNKS